MTSTVLYFVSAFFGLLGGIPMVTTGLYSPLSNQKMEKEIKKDPLKVIERLKISVSLWLIAWIICALAWVFK